MKITIVDVAKKANVSVATVSRVINDNYPVNSKTKAKVQKVIKELNFIPNLQAREVKKRKTKTIGVIVPSVENMFFPEVINGIEQHLMQKSYSLLLSFSKNSEEKEQECVRNLLSRNVAGMIVADVNTTNVESGFYDDLVQSTPIVFINGESSREGFSHVLCDERDGANKALQSLWDKGHRDIYFVRGGSSYSYDVKEQAYRDFLRLQDEDVNEHIVYVGEGNSNQVIDVTCKLMVEKIRQEGCSAAFCCNDLMAIGVLNACKEIGVSVPDEFSIIGFDNIILSKLVEPKLTTIDQNMYELGNQAAKLILETIKEEQSISKKVVLNATFVPRETLAEKKG